MYTILSMTSLSQVTNSLSSQHPSETLQQFGRHPIQIQIIQIHTEVQEHVA
jgi:hypothetical protein